MASSVAVVMVVPLGVIADRHRIEEFQTKTLPVIQHYDEMGLLVEIDANLPKDEVELQVLGALAVRAGVNINARIVEEAN